MPVSERTTRRVGVRSVDSSYRRQMGEVLVRQFRTHMWSEFSIDTSDWSIAQIGTQWWVIDQDSDPIILLANSDPAIALGALKGISHGLHLDETLIERGVLDEDWDQ